jgi:MFS family permease
MVLICLFAIGLALGGDYPTAHLVISESIPSHARGRLVLSAFAFQSLGALAGMGIGYSILFAYPELDAWRWMYSTAILPTLLVIVGRFSIPHSGHWLVHRGRMEEAEQEVRKLLDRDPPYPREIKLAPPKAAAASRNTAAGSGNGYRQLFQGRNLRATILAAVPWFLQDLGTYGIGIFTPTILAAAIGHETEFTRNVADLIHDDMLAAKGGALVDTLLLVGIVGAVLLADVVGRIRLQIAGFLGCAVGLFLASLAVGHENELHGMVLIVAGFMLFNFMNNLGPNAMTYLLAGEVFPTAIRGKGAGLAASFAKVGAALTAFLFPILLKDLGTQTLLFALVLTSLAGALVTWMVRIETTGISLETVGEE